MLSVIPKLGAMAPSCVKLSNYYSFPLECTADAKAGEDRGDGSSGEEPKGEITVGPCGEALEPPDSGTSLSFFRESIYPRKRKLSHTRSSS